LRNFVEIADYRINYILINSSITEICLKASLNVISCKSPSFGNLTGVVEIYLSFNQMDFYKISKTLLIYDDLSVSSFFPNEIGTSEKSLVYFYGKNFLNSSSIMIKLKDPFRSITFPSVFINSTTTLSTISILKFYEMNMGFPQNLYVSISLDAGETYLVYNEHLIIQKMSKKF
jgi:hypothetical protein